MLSKETSDISSVNNTQRSSGVSSVKVNPFFIKRPIISIRTWARNSQDAGFSVEVLGFFCFFALAFDVL